MANLSSVWTECKISSKRMDILEVSVAFCSQSNRLTMRWKPSEKGNADKGGRDLINLLDLGKQVVEKLLAQYCRSI